MPYQTSSHTITVHPNVCGKENGLLPACVPTMCTSSQAMHSLTRTHVQIKVKAVQRVCFPPGMLLCPGVQDEGVQSLLVQGLEGWPEAAHRAAEEPALGIGPHRPHQVARKLHWDGA